MISEHVYLLVSNLKSPDEHCCVSSKKLENSSNQDLTARIPILSLDAFATVVRMSFLWPNERLRVEDILCLTRLLFPVVTVQALLTIGYSKLKAFRANPQNALSSDQSISYPAHVQNTWQLITRLLSELLEQPKGMNTDKESHSNDNHKGNEEALSVDSDRSEIAKLPAMDELLSQLANYCLPFLRRTSLFIHSCSLNSDFSRKLWQSVSTLKDQDKEPSISSSVLYSLKEFSMWTKLLQLPSDIDDVLSQSPLIDHWINEVLSSWSQFHLFQPLLTCEALQLFPLDTEFHKLLVRYRDVSCPRCGKIPATPVLCLFCGQILCAGESCCQNERKDSECQQHASYCTGGRGIFLFIKECGVFLLRKGEEKFVSGCFFPSIYLDRYGEEDIGFNRGKPLFLSKERYEKLCHLWLSNDWDDEIIKLEVKRYLL